MTGGSEISYRAVGFLTLAALLFTGCIGVSNVRSSKPVIVNESLPTRFERYVGEMFIKNDIQFCIEPINRKTRDTMLLPLPYAVAETTSDSNTFLIQISFKATSSGFTFDPQGITYWVSDSKETHHPSRFRGPYNPRYSSDKPWRTFPVEPIDLKANECTSAWIEFDVPSPDPVQPFFITIDGLKKNGSSVELPTIQFAETTHTDSVVLP